MSKLKKGTVLIGVTPVDTTKPKSIPAVPKGGELPEPKDNQLGSHTTEKFEPNRPRE